MTRVVQLPCPGIGEDGSPKRYICQGLYVHQRNPAPPPLYLSPRPHRKTEPIDSGPFSVIQNQITQSKYIRFKIIFKKT